MRFVIALTALVAVLAPGAAQSIPYAFVAVEPPSPEAIVIIHPTAPGRLFLPGGTELGACPVQVGHSTDDPWGECFFESPMPEAELIVVQPHEAQDGLLVLDDPIALEAPAGPDGWTTVDLGLMRGGGHTDGPIYMRAAVPDHGICIFGTLFHLEIRSPDITGDLAVDLTDIVLFVQALGEYRAYADFWPDGTVNLSDIVIMSQGIFDR
jgi:hypothetical protein